MNGNSIYLKHYLKILSIRKDTTRLPVNVYPFILNWYFLHYLGRYFSAIVTPLFIFAKIKPNTVSIARYIICMLSFLILLWNNDILTFKILFFSLLMNYFLLDFVDGDIARVEQKSTFFGRILDSWIDMHLQANIYLFSGYITYYLSSDKFYLYLGVFVFFMVFLSNLNIDRYASFRRWIIDDHGIDIGTHKLNSFFLSLRHLHSDLVVLNLLIGCFTINSFLIKILLYYGLFWNCLYFINYLYLQFANVNNISDKPKFKEG